MGFSKRITWVEAAANWHIVYWKHSGVVSREAPACLNSFMQAAGWGRHRVWNCRLTLIDSGCHFAMMWRCGQRLGCFFFPPLLTLKTVKKLSTILHQWLYYTVLNQLEREREREKSKTKNKLQGLWEAQKSNATELLEQLDTMWRQLWQWVKMWSDDKNVVGTLFQGRIRSD